MNSHDPHPALLAREFTRRINQLGLSRRQLTIRSGLSRQTLHNIEHGGRTDLKPATLQALDRALLWRVGTAMALAQGDESALDKADNMMAQEKESAFRWRIVERIQRMPLEELERMVSMMEGEALGESEPQTMDQVIARVEANVLERLERQRLAAPANPGDERSRQTT